MTRRYLLFAVFLGFSGVAIGAFGAHGLESLLEENQRASTFETGARYHMYHALALLGVAWLSSQQVATRWINWSGHLLLIGTCIFSGSLYALAITDVGLFGAIAPIGGTALLAGWGCLGLAAWQSTGSSTA